MAFFSVENLQIRGIATCSAPYLQKVADIPFLSEKDAEIFSNNTGINQRYIADSSICASDLCQQAANQLIAKLDWDKSEIDVLIFISQTSDYILPATSNLLQHKLGLSKDCLCLDISLGCSAYVYGLSVVGNFLQNKQFKKALLLVGDTISRYSSPNDKSVFPLFGDVGSATAIEYDKSTPSIWHFEIGTDGNGSDAIKINDGGARNKIENENSLKPYQIDPENEISGSRRNVDLVLNGTDIFNFAIKVVPETIKKLLENTNTPIEDIDLLYLHQANMFMNETIRKKLKFSKEKTPNSLPSFGNTNGASIPLTIVNSFQEIEKTKEKLDVVLCGFGVGLSWGAVKLDISSNLITDFSFYEKP
jgi:3-oxoacyl-[acyl-carrier-protein] synthase III